ncbi:MAG: 4'-phosphopantetheinyl transferase superfamily protein [Bacteroidales bacterium]|nr:4'-phosphopantetheinyl transferase superfamily protein [Bacteroidales bacterium]MDD3962362.1 4'-phosphopantetheinyl transferase superfamily protein [Bacteroidales bacterium]HPE87332.1 4'-phosphopantetheinyl transferase superfamily protein [Bacteroidales bacterium]
MINVYYMDIHCVEEHTLLEYAAHQHLDAVIERYHATGNSLTASHYLYSELLMRLLFRHELGISLPDQQFSINIHGKPQPEGVEGWYFNKSHSVDYVVVATGPVPVGVDVEKIRQARMHVAIRYFSSTENGLLDAISSPERRDQLFYQLWTSREAYLKFLGQGIAYGLSNFSIVSSGHGDFCVEDPVGLPCELHLTPLPDLYQLAICTELGQKIEIQRITENAVRRFLGFPAG